MFTTLHCIALRTVRHSDSRNIVSAWSREAGRVAFAFPAGAGREARRRKAIASPMGMFEGVCDFRPGRDIQSIRDVRPMPGSIAMEYDPVKSMLAIFLSEALDLLLRRTEPDESLSDFLFGSMRVLASLENASATANFHLVFLYRLMAYAGITPDTDSYAPGRLFDMREGRFRASAPLHTDYLIPSEAAIVPLLDRLTYRTMHCFKLTRAQRNAVLDAILSYYAIHLAPLSSVKSLAVLREL